VRAIHRPPASHRLFPLFRRLTSSSFANLCTRFSLIDGRLRDESAERVRAVATRSLGGLQDLVDGTLAEMTGNVDLNEVGIEDGAVVDGGGGVPAALAPPHSFAAMSEQLRRQEADILSLVSDNHRRREQLKKVLANNKDKYEATHSALLALVLKQQYQQKKLPSSTSNATGPSGEGGNGDHNGQQEPGGSGEDLLDGLDWEELLQFEPSRENLELFLEARAMYERADKRFGEAVEEISQHLRDCLEQIETVTAEVYDVVADALGDQERDIRSHLSTNLDRRQAFERNVQETALQSQSFFARLLSSVKNYSSVGCRAPAIAATAANAPSTG